MATSLEAQLGVGEAGKFWDVGDYRLWQSTDPGSILYIANRPLLARNADTGRAQVSVTQFRKFSGQAYETIGGSALITATLGSADDLSQFSQRRAEWQRILLNKGYTGPSNLKFLPMPIRNVSTHLVLPPALGKVSQNSDSNSGSSYIASTLVELTPAGADQLTKAVRTGADVPGTISFDFEYLQYLPEVQARVTVRGLRAFTHFSQVLNRADDGIFFGTATEINQAWDDLVADGALTVDFGGPLPPPSDQYRQNLVNRFAAQAREQLFSILFLPMESMPPGGAKTGQYVLSWKKSSDAQDFNLLVTFGGWNWISASANTDLSTVVAGLDESYISIVYTQTSITLSISVEPEPLVSTAAVSLSFSDGHGPVSFVFGSNGGSAEVTITAARPDLVSLSSKTQIAFTPKQWPILLSETTTTMRESGGLMVVRPSEWIHRRNIYAYFRDGSKILPNTQIRPDDHLVLNISYTDSNSSPIRESAHITPLAPVEFRFPVIPGALEGKLVISALGLIGGQALKSRELTLGPNETQVFMLVDQNGVQLVSKSTVVAEDDVFAQRLVEADARPVVKPASTSNMALTESGQDIDVAVDLELIPQPTEVSCWAASLAMVLGYRDRSSYTPQSIAQQAGMDVDTGYGWDRIQAAVSTWQLKQTGPASAMPSYWAGLLRSNGPLWIVETGAPYHAIVLAGISGDGAPEDTFLTVYNPWPPSRGIIEYKPFVDFDLEFGLGAGAGAMIVHA